MTLRREAGVEIFGALVLGTAAGVWRGREEVALLLAGAVLDTAGLPRAAFRRGASAGATTALTLALCVRYQIAAIESSWSHIVVNALSNEVLAVAFVCAIVCSWACSRASPVSAWLAAVSALACASFGSQTMWHVIGVSTAIGSVVPAATLSFGETLAWSLTCGVATELVTQTAAHGLAALLFACFTAAGCVSLIGFGARSTWKARTDRQRIAFAVALGMSASASVLFVAYLGKVAALGTLPVVFTSETATMLLFMGVAVLVGAPAAQYVQIVPSKPTIGRKLHHALALILFGPGLLWHRVALGVSFAWATAAFIGVEALRQMFVQNNIRISWVDGVNSFLHRRLSKAEQRGAAVAHTQLLLGCALPFWLSASHTPAWLAGAGLACTGVGDACASVVGSLYGRNRVPFTGKSFQGALAFTIGTVCTTWALGALEGHSVPVNACFIAATVTAVLEASTSQSDNVIVGLAYWSLLPSQTG